MKNSLMIIGVLALVVLSGFGIYFQAQASYHCGFKKSMLYGKNVTWAYVMGYCDEH